MVPRAGNLSGVVSRSSDPFMNFEAMVEIRLENIEAQGCIPSGFSDCFVCKRTAVSIICGNPDPPIQCSPPVGRHLATGVIRRIESDPRPRFGDDDSRVYNFGACQPVSALAFGVE